MADTIGMDLHGATQALRFGWYPRSIGWSAGSRIA